MACRLQLFILRISWLFLLAWVYPVKAALPAQFDDWISTSDPQYLCHGYYLQQPTAFPKAPKSLLKSQPALLTADHGQFALEGNSTLTGHIHLLQGNTQLFADKAIIHRDPQKKRPIDWLKATGNIKMTEPGIRVDGTDAEIWTESGIKKIYKACYRLYERHARGTAEEMILYQQTKMHLKNVTYSTCSPLQNTWHLKTNQIEFNRETGRGQATHARLYLYDVPIFYFPYVDFPIDNRRQTGFLFPLIGFNNRSGFEVGVPFYLNLAPNYDAVITPRFLSKRGLELQGKFRYLFAKSQGEAEGSLLPLDRHYRQFRESHLNSHPNIAATDPRVTGLHTTNHRYSVRLKHHTHFTEQWSSNLHYQKVSDDNYFMDFGNHLGIANTTHLLQEATLLYQGSYGDIQARLQQHQTLHPFNGPITTEPYKRLPQITLNISDYKLPYGAYLRVVGDFSHFTHASDLNTGDAVTVGDRFQLRPGISLPIVTPGWYVNPRIQWNLLTYSLTLGPNDVAYLRERKSQIIPLYDIDSGLTFERTFTFHKTAYLQTLEPRAYYLYVPFRDQNSLPLFDTTYLGFDYNQLYWENRFTGLDRIGDANQLTVGLTSRFLSAETGQERLYLSLGQIFYFQERKVSACTQAEPNCLDQQFSERKKSLSHLIGLVRYSLPDFWTLSANLEWDLDQRKIAKEGLHIQYRPNSSSVLNVGYQFLRHNPLQTNPNNSNPINQSDISLALALTTQWRILSRWQYDVQNHHSNEIAAGLEQQGCCTAIRLFFSHFLQPYESSNPNQRRQYSNAIFLQFIFKGFAGIGHQHLDSTLQRTIVGYRWHPEKF